MACRNSWIFISPSIQQESLSCLKIENACFSVWCMDVCVPSGTPVSNFLTWKHNPSKEVEKQFLSDTLFRGPCVTDGLPLLCHLGSVDRRLLWDRALIIWVACRKLCWVFCTLVVVISSIRILLVKLFLHRKDSSVVPSFQHEAQIWSNVHK